MITGIVRWAKGRNPWRAVLVAAASGAAGTGPGDGRACLPFCGEGGMSPAWRSCSSRRHPTARPVLAENLGRRVNGAATHGNREPGRVTGTHRAGCRRRTVLT